MSQFIKYILSRYKKPVAILAVLGIFSGITSIIMNYSLKYAVDYLFGVENTRGGIAILLFFVMAITTYATDQIAENYFVMKHQIRFVKNLRKDLLKRYRSLSYQEARQKNLGSLMNLDDLAEEVGELYVTLTYTLPYYILESVGFIIFLSIFVSWKMNVILVLMIPFALLFKKITEAIRKASGEIVQKKSEGNSLFFDILSKLEYVKANGFAGLMKKKYEQKNQELLNSQKRLQWRNMLLSVELFFLENGVKILVPCIGSYMLLRGEMTPGGVAVSTTIFSSFLMPSVFQLIGIYKDIKGAQELVVEIMENLSHKPEETMEEIDTLPEEVLVQIQGAAYSYNKAAVFQNLSLNLPVRGSVGICGVSGTGKSTLGKMAASLLRPTEGKIIYNAKYFSGNVRDGIAYVDEKPFFLEDTLYQNIVSGGSKWKEALHWEGMLSVLRQLAERENTRMQEDGGNLSGGQRQMTAVARAIAKPDTRLLILDEPTSALDATSRDLLLQKVQELAKNQCVLVITHQMDVLAQMDYQFRLDSGRIYNYRAGENINEA